MADQQLGAVRGGQVLDIGGHPAERSGSAVSYDAPMGVGDGWVEIADRCFVRRYAFLDQNIGAILGGGEVLVIDTRSTTAMGREIVDDLRELSGMTRSWNGMICTSSITAKSVPRPRKRRRARA